MKELQNQWSKINGVDEIEIPNQIEQFEMEMTETSMEKAADLIIGR